jgi:hypothetical protein
MGSKPGQHRPEFTPLEMLKICDGGTVTLCARTIAKARVTNSARHMRGASVQTRRERYLKG